MDVIKRKIKNKWITIKINKEKNIFCIATNDHPWMNNIDCYWAIP
jgi:hypothetical protein